MKKLSETLETKMLEAYARKFGPVMAEVRIGGPHPEGMWPAECTARRIDGVRIVGQRRSRGGGALSKAPSPDDLIDVFRDKRVEVIEAKKKLNRGVIGQAIVASDMFDRQYRPRLVEPVALVAMGDEALQWVCGRHGIKVWLFDDERGEFELLVPR